MKEIPKWVFENLCCYDKRNPDSDITGEENLVDSTDEDCFCDNCFYSRTKLAEYIIEILEKEL